MLINEAIELNNINNKKVALVGFSQGGMISLQTAIKRKEDNPELKGMVYTVGNEQDYHFKVLFIILKRIL